MRDGWTTNSLGDVIIPSGTIDPRKEPERTFNYVDVSSISRTALKIVEPSVLLGKDAPSRARRLIQEGDVLLATVRPTLKRVAIVPQKFDGEVCSTGYFVFRTKAELDNKYLFYYLLTDDFMGSMERLQSGASYPAVNDGQVKQQEIAYPSLPEQKRIVAILDEAFAGIDTAITNTEKNLANARELFDSYLNSVFTQKIEGWTESTLKDSTDLLTCGVAARPKYVEKGIPFLSAKNVKRGKVIWGDYKFVSEETHEKLTKYSKPLKGDILYTRVGSYGEAAIVDKDIEFSIFVSLTLIKPKEFILNSFLKYYLNSSFVKRLASESISGSGVGNLNVGTVRRFPIKYPDILIQEKIVTEITALEVEAQRLEVIYRQKLDSLNELKQSLLQKAFSGELTTEADKLKEDAVA